MLLDFFENLEMNIPFQHPSTSFSLLGTLDVIYELKGSRCILN